MISVQELVSQILECQSAILSAHISPDSDAVGSAYGLALGLKQLGKDVEVYLADPIPPRILPLVSGQVRVIHQPPSRDYDTFIALDTASKKRIGSGVDQLLGVVRKSYNIDHHISNDQWAAVNYVDATAAATAQIVLRLLLEMGVIIDHQMANLLYGGLLDDTGCFRYSNTSVAALEAAARLVELGAEPLRVANLLHFSQPEKVLRLRAAAIAGVKLYYQGKLAVVAVTQQMLSSNGASAEDSEGIVDEARSLAGVVGVVMLREMTDGWKLSLRAKDEALDVSAIAAEFGGGGHRAAAGCKIVGTQQQIEQTIVERFGAPLQRLGS